MLESKPEDVLVKLEKSVETVKTVENVETVGTVETMETVDSEETVETVYSTYYDFLLYFFVNSILLICIWKYSVFVHFSLD